MKILILSDGIRNSKTNEIEPKFGDRAVEVVKTEFPDTKLVAIEEMDPRQLIDEYEFPDEIESLIKESDLLISYIRHPDVASELCYYDEKPVILAIYFGEGFVKQLQEDNPNVVMPSSMCHLLPDSNNLIINEFAKKFGKPIFNIVLDDLIIKEISLSAQSPCGASKAGIDFLNGKKLTKEILNEYALLVRHECREPLSVILNRSQMAETAMQNHLNSLFLAIKEANPELLKRGTEIHEYVAKFELM